MLLVFCLHIIDRLICEAQTYNLSTNIKGGEQTYPCWVFKDINSEHYDEYAAIDNNIIVNKTINDSCYSMQVIYGNCFKVVHPNSLFVSRITPVH